VFVEDCAG